MIEPHYKERIQERTDFGILNDSSQSHGQMHKSFNLYTNARETCQIKQYNDK